MSNNFLLVQAIALKALLQFHFHTLHKQKSLYNPYYVWLSIQIQKTLPNWSNLTDPKKN